MATKVVSQSIMDAFARVLGLLDQTRDELDSTIGQLGALTTVEKTDVVGAVNEVNETSVSKLAKDQVTFDLSYHILVPTNKGCVVEGGFLPVYQLVDPKFDFEASANYSINGGALTIEQVINTVNVPAGEIRHPKPTDFEVLPESTDVTVSYEPETRKVTVNIPSPASGSVSYTVRMKGGSKAINITVASVIVVVPSMYGDWLNVITRGEGNEPNPRLPNRYGLDITVNNPYGTVDTEYDFSKMNRVEIVFSYPAEQQLTDEVYDSFHYLGNELPVKSIADISRYIPGADVQVNTKSNQVMFRFTFSTHKQLKNLLGQHLLTIGGPKGAITNTVTRFAIFGRNAPSHIMVLPRPTFGQSVTP